jgi:tRNA(Glu) U13 pseudouridine synthase TruD
VPETWYTFSEKNKMMAEQAMAESQRLREAIFHAIEQTSNDLRSIFIHSYQYIYTYC